MNVEVGLRRGELVDLRPEHVDIDGAVLRVLNEGGFKTKSGRNRAIPLSTTARAVLSRRLRQSEAYVFEAPKGRLTPNGLSHAFLRVRKRAGLPDWASVVAVARHRDRWPLGGT